MNVFNLEEKKPIGRVQSVDTTLIIVNVDESEMLSKLQVNNMVVIQSSKVGQYLIGLVNKITRKYNDVDIVSDDDEEILSYDLIKITMIGTFIDIQGVNKNVFKRTLESVPEIDSKCYMMDEQTVTAFMGALTNVSSESDNPLCIGKYALNGDAQAWLDGNKFFQRHAVIAGSTGSGKSWTVATMIEQIAKLSSANAIVFDIHGEYKTIVDKGIKNFKVAGPSDKNGEVELFLPYWLLTYEEMLSMMLDRSDNNAPNQAMVFSRAVLECKKEYLISIGKDDLAENITIDSPIPYDMKLLIEKITYLDHEDVPGSTPGKTKAGDFKGKLSRFLQRLNSKVQDKRLNFIFSSDTSLLDYGYTSLLLNKLMAPSGECENNGVKIIDFSEVPSDVLPLIVSLIARLVFSVQQWMDRDKILPIALFCDEAHLYIPNNVNSSAEISSLSSFERIAKEGRKYGVGLVVITQRPSEVNRTVLSQSSNYIAMRLTNVEDQSVIKRLMPDNLGDFADLLPILDIGEAIVVGDACLLPSRIKITEPNKKPNSMTIKFWDEWAKKDSESAIDSAIESLRKQSK